ncbi:hypothetical protein BJX99DRAFT_249724 [Aspergillus californicus]
MRGAILPQRHTAMTSMLPQKSAFSSCENCRLRRRRCDRVKPRCSSCSSQEAECIYRQGNDPQPSQFVRELAGIRERLDLIARLVKSPSPPTIPRNSAGPAPSNCPCLVMKSQSLMQIVGLRSDLSSFLYGLENVPSMVESPVQFGRLGISDGTATVILQTFRDRVHQWYPVLHADFTHHFFETNAAGFPHSTKSCLSLLVASIACLDDAHSQSPYIELALSMIPLVLMECSLTSVQCLTLFSIYYACQLQPRQSYDYIQTASLRIQPLLKIMPFAEGSSEWHLATRLYWIIYMIQSETSGHLNLSAIDWSMRSSFTSIPVVTKTDSWEYNGLSDSPSSSPFSMTDQGSKSCSPRESPESPLYFSTELQLHLACHKTVSHNVEFSQTGHAFTVPSSSARDLYPDSLPSKVRLGISPDIQGISPQHMHGAVSRVKYHFYELSVYWPVIYRIIIDGFADPEILPYGPLFFESVTSFLCAATEALRISPAKTWPMCASIFIISMVSIRAMDVPCLRRLSQPGFWQYIKASADALHRPGTFSPSVLYMHQTLEDRLLMVNLN